MTATASFRGLIFKLSLLNVALSTPSKQLGYTFWVSL